MAAKRDDDELRALLRAVPQRIVGQLCGGRQTVQLQRLADRWGFPIAGRTVDLFAVMSRLWEFLKRYGPLLSAVLEDTGEAGDENALGVRYLRAKIAKTEADAAAAQLRVEQKAGRLCDRELIHQSLTLLAERIRRTSDVAIRRWGNDAADLFEQLAIGYCEDVKTMFPDDNVKPTDNRST